MEKERNLGIDILCCIGVMFLLGLQYIHVAGFSATPVTDWTAIPTLSARCFCQSGAMILSAGTGYILSRKKFSAGYFKIFIRLIYIYLTCSILALFLRSVVLDEFLSRAQEVQAVIQFTATETSRFAAMYFPLLLFAPFVNTAFNGLENRNQRLCLLGIVSLSTLQPLLYISETYLLSEWCKGLFPLAGYLGGAMIQKYSKQKHNLLVTVIMIAVWICETLIVYDSSIKKGELYCPWLNSVSALPNLCIALCLLELFHSQKTGDSSLHKFFAGAAGGALSALLLGDPVINIMMPALRERIPDLIPRLWAGYFVVPIVFVLCCTAGLILQIPYHGVRNFIHSNEEEEEDEEKSEEENQKVPKEEPAKEIAVPSDPEPVPVKKAPKPKNPRPTESPRPKTTKKPEPSPSNPPAEPKPKESVKKSSPKNSPSSVSDSSKQKNKSSANPNKKRYEIHIEENSDPVPRRILTQPASLPVLKHAGKPVEKKEETPEPPRRKTADEIIGIYDTSTLNGLMEAIKQRKDDSE